ncbi:hypothetical protein ABO04_08310 [Nitrosomonas sp. HPC101]|uniref:hypothetical protein n=1 Tax=Nitrosomonas sp. HPC101 TaxID=1658667 RepID=UPI00136D0CED|nr:hypothetical protein [Nitrosomonas sp. HPC101]MXS85908.1 hypothetical protein [Nitrosomonas sp. HPC101]
MTEAVIVTMEQDTVLALQNGGYRLYGFRATRTENQAVLPVLWLATTAYSTRTMVALEDGYHVYTSNSDLGPGQRIFMGFTASVDLGQCLIVDQAGIGQVVQGRIGFMSVDNTGSATFVAGLAQRAVLNEGTQTDDPTSFFAEPLYGKQTNFFQPTSKILLVLSTEVLTPGTAIDALPLLPKGEVAVHGMAQTSGIFIDVTATRMVNFDINRGWSWGEANWARLVNVSTDLIDTLIE